MRHSITIAITAIWLTGCTVSHHAFVPTKEKQWSYVLGRDTSVTVGDAIVEVENVGIFPVYAVIRDYEPTGAVYDLLKTGTRFSVSQITDDGDYIISSDGYHNGQLLIGITPNGVPSHIMDSPVSGTWVKDVVFAAVGGGRVADGSFKAELIFTGLTGSTVKTVYREYVSDYARPAFTTELQYNLDESRTIAYKSIKIEVLKATNQALTYRVVSDDGLPWVK